MLELGKGLLAWISRPFTERNKGNLRLLAGCFCISCLLWLLNCLNRNLEAELQVPLQIQYDQEQYAPLAATPLHATVQVEGHGWFILKSALFQKTEPEIIRILSPNIHTELDTAALKNHLQSVFPALTIKSVSMRQICLPFDRKGKKWCLMQVNKNSISIKKGYSIKGQPELTPDSILVTGPLTHLTKLADTLYVSIPFEQIDKDFNENIRLDYFLNDAVMQAKPSRVNVKFSIDKANE